MTLRILAAAVALVALTPAALAANPPALQLPGAGDQPAGRPQLQINQPQQQTGEDIAVAACVDFTAGAEPVAVTDDGLDDFTVWLTDAGDNLFLCNADEEGNVYAHVAVDQDLLGGEGAAYVPVGGSAASAAEWICSAVSDADAGYQVIATVEDGLPNQEGESFYLVWLESAQGELVMCDASARGEIFAYEPVNYALNEEPSGPALNLPTS